MDPFGNNDLPDYTEGSGNFPQGGPNLPEGMRLGEAVAAAGSTLDSSVDPTPVHELKIDTSTSLLLSRDGEYYQVILTPIDSTLTPDVTNC
jgi:hypothetical protein